MSRTTNHRALLAALFAAGTLSIATAHAASTLVYCSEGSPEGFQPQFFTTGTTFDAASVPMFNRLVEFELGSTNIVPGLSEKTDVSADGKGLHVPSAQGVSNFTATRCSRRRAISMPMTSCSHGREWPIRITRSTRSPRARLTRTTKTWQ
jgi:dipeptide transport system substrate-binding protein